jgi:hypothetical protein
MDINASDVFFYQSITINVSVFVVAAHARLFKSQGSNGLQDDQWRATHK